MNIGGHIIDNLIWNNRKKCDDMKPVYAALMADKYPDKLRHILWRGGGQRPENTMCAATRRQQILGTLARPRRGDISGKEPKSYTFYHGAVRIYLKGAHRIQRTASTVLLLRKWKSLSRRCRRPNMCKEKAAIILPRLVAVPQKDEKLVYCHNYAGIHYNY
jgi:hypothetical protein